MSVPDFRNGQILFCHYKDGDFGICIFDRKEEDDIFRGTNFTWFAPSRGVLRKEKSGCSYYVHDIVDIQWQLATFEQIRKYGYEKHLDLSVQFPDIQPENKSRSFAQVLADGLKPKEQKTWIPLSEQLPPVGKDVVFARYEYNDYGRTVTGFITDEGKPPYLYNIRHLWEPTHWCDCLPDALHSTKKEAVAEPDPKNELMGTFNPERVTLEQLLTEPKYREMSEDELARIVGNYLTCSWDDFFKLDGENFFDKARILKEKWAKEEAEKTCISTDLGAVSQTPEPQPFTVTEDMWVEMDDLVRGLSIRIQMLSDKLKRKA